MVAKNEHTGDAIKTKAPSKEYDEGWERIFGKKDVLCTVCGNCLKDVLDCNKNSCPKNEET